MNTVEPFRIDVADAVLEDLHLRLKNARLPSAPIGGGRESPETLRKIEELVAYWRDGYDWRARERELNELPHYQATVDGVRLHFLQMTGSGPDPLPLLLVNGWPSSFVEYSRVIESLARPDDPGDAFTVIVPAMPGYGFSAPCPDRRLDRAEIARLFDRLMTEHLGHRRYVAHGDDVGGGVVNRLGIHHTDGVLAIQTTNWLKAPGDQAGLTDEETAYLDAERRWDRTRGAYAHVQETHPQTLAYGLDDSPLGLAAWIVEKFLTWSDPATRGRITDDDLVTNLMIYWVTRSIGSSARPYTVDKEPVTSPITAPASILLTHEPELPIPPASWLRRAYSDLRRITTLDKGGHFLGLEAPERLAAEIREAFRPWRG